MRVVIGAVLTAVMGCVFTVIAAVVFVTNHLFAGMALAVAAAAVVGAAARRRWARRAQRGPGHQSTILWAAPDMSSAALARRRLPTLPLAGVRP
jgi:hypothetical protein